MIRLFQDAARVLGMRCDEHAQLMNRELESGLTRGERVGLWVHTRYCRGCRGLKRQLAALEAMAGSLRRAVDAEPGLPPEVRERLAVRVRTEAEK
ncbi:MAG: hypothetical protein ACKVZJ_06410 [Phycisphaerales bacterium]